MGSALDLDQEIEQATGPEARTRQTYTSDSTIPILSSLLREAGGQLVLDYGAFDVGEGVEPGSLSATVTNNQTGAQSTFNALPLGQGSHTGSIGLGVGPADYPVTVRIEVLDRAGHKNYETLVYPPNP